MHCSVCLLWGAATPLCRRVQNVARISCITFRIWSSLCYFYSTVSAHPVSVPILHPKEIHIPWPQAVRHIPIGPSACLTVLVYGIHPRGDINVDSADHTYPTRRGMCRPCRSYISYTANRFRFKRVICTGPNGANG